MARENSKAAGPHAGRQRALELIAIEKEARTGFLDLGRLDLAEIPEELFELTHLTYLNLGWFYRDRAGKFLESTNQFNSNSINDLTGQCARLTELTHLSVFGCPFSGIESVSRSRSLQSLDCSVTQVSDLGPLTGLPSLQSLCCSGTRVSDLGPLTGLPSLQSLNCSGTRVSDLGLLKDLPSLQSLYCSDTHVSDLGPLAGLPSLQSLNCSATQVNDLGPLKGMPLLQSLNCSDTQVSDLGPLKGMPSLQSLDCSSTQVNDLGPLDCLSSLRELKCNGLDINELPDELIFGVALESVRFWQTKIPGIPPEALSDNSYDDCLQKLRAHLTDLKAGGKPVRHSKLVVLGNGRLGKTQLCRALQRLPFDESIPTTHGINIVNIRWRDAGEDERINLWDFGGQDIYHGTHALFLKSRSIFLLVWHPDFEFGKGRETGGVEFQNRPMAYWLEYIRTLGREQRPAIIVQARCDRPEMEKRQLPVDEAYLKMPFLKVCHFSAKQKRGIAALREAITEAVHYIHENEGVSIIGAGRMKVLTLLEDWRKADQKLSSERRKHRVLTLAEFEAVCEQAGGVSSPTQLLQYLHDLGTVFHEKELFEGKIILDQTWALEAVYAVFNREKSCRQIMSLAGRFTRSLLELAVWNTYSKSEQELFISLMKSCGICFLYREADVRQGLEAEYAAPDLLPEKAMVASQMEGRWDETVPSRQLVFEYPFLHQGLMRTLICDLGERAGDAGVYWKYGAWVYERRTGCRLLIEQDMINDCQGRITARLQGDKCEDLGVWLRNQINTRNRLFGYADLKPQADEFPVEEESEPKARHADVPQAESIGEASKSEPDFEAMPVAQFPSRKPEIFVSYAWGDSTPEGQTRGKLVDDLCAALKTQGVDVIRDRDEMEVGDRISEFMKRLVEGDFIICVISEKYLRSPFCMYELFHIYRKCGDREKDFLKKVIPLILPDAKLKDVSDRLEYAGYWKEQRVNLEKKIKKYGIDVVGEQAMQKYFNIQKFSHSVSDILELLVDKLMPRDFDRMAKEGFKEVLQLVRGKDDGRTAKGT